MLRVLSTSGSNSNPTFFQSRAALEPYNREQWGSVLTATPSHH
jgi:hypothetical protein